MDKEKFDEAIWDLFMMETMHRTNGNPIQADRVKNIRVKLKEAVEQSVLRTVDQPCEKHNMEFCSECFPVVLVDFNRR
jgi:hypothetical protein